MSQENLNQDEITEHSPTSALDWRNPEHPEYTKKWAVAAGVFRKPTLSAHEILLLRRSELNDWGAGNWEIPGGSIEREKDVDVEAALQRELLEETGLKLNNVIKQTQIMPYGNHGLQNRMLSFIVSVENADIIRLRAEEHDEHAWVTEEKLGDYKMTEEKRKVVLNMFQLVVDGSEGLQC